MMGRSNNTERLVEAASKVLTSESRPMHAQELVTAIEMTGVIIAGKNKRASLTACLSPYFRFQSLGKGIWQMRASLTYMGSTENTRRLADRAG